MQITDIKSHARQMFDQAGPKAIPVAAQKASEFEQRGNPEQAAIWRKIESMLKEMRGPRET